MISSSLPLGSVLAQASQKALLACTSTLGWETWRMISSCPCLYLLLLSAFSWMMKVLETCLWMAGESRKDSLMGLAILSSCGNEVVSGCLWVGWSLRQEHLDSWSGLLSACQLLLPRLFLQPLSRPCSLQELLSFLLLLPCLLRSLPFPYIHVCSA